MTANPIEKLVRLGIKRDIVRVVVGYLHPDDVEAALYHARGSDDPAASVLLGLKRFMLPSLRKTVFSSEWREKMSDNGNKPVELGLVDLEAGEVGEKAEITTPAGTIRPTWLGVVGDGPGAMSLTEAMRLMCEIDEEREAQAVS